MGVIKIKNRLRTNIEPVLMGDDCFPPIISNVGVTADSDSLRMERQKMAAAIKCGANMITDLTLVGDIPDVQKRILENLTVPFSVVSAYEIYSKAQKNNMKLSEDDFIKTIEEQAIRGVDLLIVHATVLREDDELLRNSNRNIPSTSRAALMILELLKENGYENPFYTHFDEILEIAKKYSVCISLAGCYRPGSVCDAYLGEPLHMLELDRMAPLVKKAQEKNVGITVEGVGHAPINVMSELIKYSKRLFNDAPYRVMTVSTDIALGYDHIASAIGCAVAVMNGADSVTCISRSEHIGHPTIEEIEEAVIAARIGVYSGYIARTGDLSKDRLMSESRHNSGCSGNPNLALFPEGAQKAIEKFHYEQENKECTMCGPFCPYNISDKILKNEKK